MSYEPKHCEIVTGDLLEASDTMIVHQCNCVSIGRAAGIARAIFDRFPWADCYTRRTGKRMPLMREMPGDIDICGMNAGQRMVINLFGQFHPGGPSDDEDEVDHPENRVAWFAQGLARLRDMVSNMIRLKLWTGEVSVAFPWQIGCGIAGGDWDGRYLPLIDDFAKALGPLGVRVHIYRLPE